MPGFFAAFGASSHTRLSAFLHEKKSDYGDTIAAYRFIEVCHHLTREAGADGTLLVSKMKELNSSPEVANAWKERLTSGDYTKAKITTDITERWNSQKTLGPQVVILGYLGLSRPLERK